MGSICGLLNRLHPLLEDCHQWDKIPIVHRCGATRINLSPTSQMLRKRILPTLAKKVVESKGVPVYNFTNLGHLFELKISC